MDRYPMPVDIPLRSGLVLLLVLSAAAQAEDLFPRPWTQGLSAPGAELLVEDLNDDGLADVAVTHEAEARVTVLLGGPPGTLTPSSVHEVGLSPVFIAAGDVDGSSGPDLVIVNSGSSTISVLLNRGDGSFASLSEVPVGGRGPRVAELADFDGDGQLDLAASNLESHTITILIGTGTGAFVDGETLPVGEKPHSMVARDFDGDGLIDLAVPIYEDRTARGRVYWFEGLGRTFARRPATDLGASVAARISVSEDFDGDGLADLCVADLGGSMFQVRNLGGWSFEARLLGQPEETSAARVVTVEAFLQAIDFDRDGDRDLLAKVEREGEYGYRVYANIAGALEPLERDTMLGRSLRSLGLCDLEGDGLLDAVVTWSGSPELRLLRGTAAGGVAGRTSIPLAAGPRGLEAVVSGEGGVELVALSASALHLVRERSAGELGPEMVIELPRRSFLDMLAADLGPAPGAELALAEFIGNQVLVVALATDGALRSVGELRVGEFPSRLAAADFDRDGAIDLAVAHNVSPFVSILFRPGARREEAEDALRLDLPVDARQTAIACADGDGDGAADVIVATRESVTVLFGDGRGGFPRSRRFDELKGARALEVADVDGDRRPDLLLARDLEIVALQALASPEPQLASVAVDTFASAFALDDLDGDARLDIVAADQDRDAVLVVRGVPGGGFGAPELYPAGVSPGALLLRDLDRDGTIDCATADSGSRSISILRGTRGGSTRVFRRGDVDLDGRLLLTDALVGFNALFLDGPEPDCADALDADDDGSVGLADVLGLLNYLFLNGSPPAAPGPSDCGEDPSADELPACTRGCP